MSNLPRFQVSESVYQFQSYVYSLHRNSHVESLEPLIGKPHPLFSWHSMDLEKRWTSLRRCCTASKLETKVVSFYGCFQGNDGRMLGLGKFVSEKNHDGKYIHMDMFVFFFGMETSCFAKRSCLGFLFGLGCVKCWGIFWGWEVVVFVVATCNLSSGICCVRGYHIYLRILDMKGRARKNPTKAADMFLIYTFYWKRFCIHFGLLMLFFLFLIVCCKGDLKPERFNQVNHVSSIVLFNQFLEAPPGPFLCRWFFVGAYKHESPNVY